MSPRVTEIRARIAAVLDVHGVDLEDVVITPVGRREMVRVVVDRDGGVDLDTIADLSSDVSAALDEATSLFPSAYVLEVTSPGVDRPLTEPRHWRRAQGRLVTVRRASGETVHGRILEGSDDSATLQLENGSDVQIAYSDVELATIDVEFTRPGEEA